MRRITKFFPLFILLCLCVYNLQAQIRPSVILRDSLITNDYRLVFYYEAAGTADTNYKTLACHLNKNGAIGFGDFRTYLKPILSENSFYRYDSKDGCRSPSIYYTLGIHRSLAWCIFRSDIQSGVYDYEPFSKPKFKVWVRRNCIDENAWDYFFIPIAGSMTSDLFGNQTLTAVYITFNFNTYTFESIRLENERGYNLKLERMKK